VRWLGSVWTAASSSAFLVPCGLFERSRMRRV